ncbi:MAG: hypothetical protein ABIT20_12830 [Gemmatimonadaceae bacterium]
MPSRPTRRATLAALFVLGLPATGSAQGLDLTINHVGLAIGDVPEVTGLRLNYRDRNLRRVDGVNVTIWTPYNDDNMRGVVRGVALGLPMTGARDIDGIALGLFGVGAQNRLRGIGFAPIGLGAGGSLEGIMVGGIGAGTGGTITGIGVGGIGLGSAGKMKGLFVGGVGVGSGEDIEGIVIGGVGVGAGRDLTGISIAGIAAGAGGTLTGLTVAGVATGAPRLRGVALSAIAVGGQDVKGLVFAGAWMRIENGQFSGVSVSSFNQVKGVQHGLAIGIVNFAEELHGVQVGLINIARNNPSGARVLPLLNWHRD